MLTDADKHTLKTAKNPSITYGKNKDKNEFSLNDLKEMSDILKENKVAESFGISQDLYTHTNGYMGGLTVLSDPDNVLFSALVSHPTIVKFHLQKIELHYKIQSGFEKLDRSKDITNNHNEFAKKINNALELKQKLFRMRYEFYEALNYNDQQKKVNMAKETANETKTLKSASNNNSKEINAAKIGNNSNNNKSESVDLISSDIEALKAAKSWLAAMTKLQKNEPLLPDVCKNANIAFRSKTLALVKIMVIINIQNSGRRIPQSEQLELFSTISKSDNTILSIKQTIVALINQYKSKGLFSSDDKFVTDLKEINSYLSSLSQEELAYRPIPLEDIVSTEQQDASDANSTTSLSSNRYSMQNGQRTSDHLAGMENANNGFEL